MNEVTLYSQPNCGPCMGVKGQLKRYGIPFTEVNIREDEKAAALLVSQGFTGTPVVQYGTQFLGNISAIASLARSIGG